MKILFITILLLGVLNAQELDDLLNSYSHNNDLSEKTKLENGGSRIIFTRKDLDVMQARNLRDVLKSNPLKRYTESRYSSPDIFYQGTAANFSSSAVRIYINNQEIISATFGSGFAGAGNINLDAINHIEIYTNSPSYEFTSEPTYMLIKLYTKRAERNRGGKITLSYGTLGFNEETLSYAQELKDFSYFTSIYATDNKREVYYSHGIPIKRDEERYGVLSSIYSDKHSFLFSAAKGNPDTSIGGSPRATYEISKNNFDYIMLGYDTTAIDDFTFSSSMNFAKLDGHSKEAVGFESPYSPEIKFERSEYTLNAELKYNLESQDNRLIVGAKVRQKSFNTDSLYVDNVLVPSSKFNEQNIFSVFVEERYNISEYNIINLAAHYSFVDNNAEVDNANLLQFRLSHTYLYNKFAFKSFIYQTESLVEPYIYTDFPTSGTLKPQKVDAISEEIKYETDGSELKFFSFYRVMHNTFYQTPTGGFTNVNTEYKSLSAYLEYTYNFNLDNKLMLNVSYSRFYDTPTSKKESAAFIRSLNTFGKFDIFNEIIFNRNKVTNKNYFDYSAGLKYHYDKDLMLSIKGENIFDKGFQESYFRVDPNTGVEESAILISPIEQRVYFTMEYLF